jgi:hypothetical protein
MEVQHSRSGAGGGYSAPLEPRQCRGVVSASQGGQRAIRHVAGNNGIMCNSSSQLQFRVVDGTRGVGVGH